MTNRHVRGLVGVGLVAVVVGAASRSLGLPQAPAIFCRTYSDAPACQGRSPSCTTCHVSPVPATWNPYGTAIRGQLKGAFESGLSAALRTVEHLDSDGDGQDNLAEIEIGTEPGKAASVWRPPLPPPVPPAGDVRFGEWDATFAYRRVKVAFCGASPTYEEMSAVRAAPDQKALVLAELATCLRSDHFRHEALPRLADPKIRPLGGAGSCYAYYANFEFDYNLFVWALTDGRDARELLTAQYHVVKAADGRLSQYQPPDPADPRIPAPARRGSATVCRDRYGNALRDPDGSVNVLSYTGGQPLLPRERAGMLTTQWFLWYHTMGAYLPRQTAAQMYRAYLGLDLSQLEGIHPVEGEPRDVDQKGVGAKPCAVCHSTLDPLAYAFAAYWGGAGDPKSHMSQGARPVFAGSYSATRPLSQAYPTAHRDAWRQASPRSHVFGQALPADTSDAPSLVALARLAADSDAFKRWLVEMLFEHGVGRPAGPEDQSEVHPIWRALPDDRYSAEAAIARIVQTRAFGAP